MIKLFVCLISELLFFPSSNIRIYLKNIRISQTCKVIVKYSLIFICVVVEFRIYMQLLWKSWYTCSYCGSHGIHVVIVEVMVYMQLLQTSWYTCSYCRSHCIYEVIVDVMVYMQLLQTSWYTCSYCRRHGIHVVIVEVMV